MINRTSKTIADGIGLTVVTDSKFKTNAITVNFICRHTEETAAANAAAAFMLEDTCSRYPTVTAFSRRLGVLYGAGIHTGISRSGDSRNITASASCIADKYALNGEEITLGTVELLLDCIFDPVTENGVFPEKQFALKKQELIDDIEADINDKRGYALKNTGRIVFRGEPAGIPVKGEKTAAEKLTSAEVFAAYTHMLRTARIEIIFAGNQFPESCERLITEKFSSMEREEVYVHKTAVSPLKSAPEYKTDRLDIVQSKMVMAFKTDITENAIISVFSAIFGSTPFSLLFKNVREKLSLCYYCSAYAYAKKGTVYVDSGVESANIAPARDEIIRQLELMAKGEFSDELLEQAKLLLICSSKAINDSPRSISGWYLDRILEGKVVTPEETAARIALVTKEDVCRYAQSLKLDTVYVLTGKEE